MNKQDIFATLKSNVLKVLPGVDESQVTPATSMVELGANSIDRVDIVMATMEDLRIKVATRELSEARNLQDLVDLMASKLE